MSERVSFEWPTLALLAACYAVWAIGTTWAATLWLPLGMALVVFGTTLHASLSHEVLHGHPFRSSFWNALLVFPAFNPAIPYLRFRDTHIAHHNDSDLTDPYDDPESNYADPAVWARLPRWAQITLRFNNTLVGRLIVGPVVAQVAFLRDDARQMAHGAPRVWLGWALHIPAVALVLWWMMTIATMPLWAWALSVYAALSVLKIRTFLEHRAHEDATGRTVVIEDRGILALLFLNNNFHVVHHLHARVPWYQLPALYRENRDHYLSANHGYRYASYGEVLRRYFWRAKDPVPHPLRPAPDHAARG